MKYTSKKGTVINIPDGLSAKDIAAIKADADAGYGTRAQATADRLGKTVASSTKGAATTTPTSSDGISHNADGTYSKNGKIIPGAQSLSQARAYIASGKPLGGAVGGTADPGITTTGPGEVLRPDGGISTGTRTETTGGTIITPDSPAGTGVVNKEDGTVNVPGAIDTVGNAENNDITTNFNLSQPRKITDQYGNSRTVVRDPVTGEVTVTDESGGTSQKFKDLAEAAASTFNGAVSRQAAYDADFGQRTKYLDRNQAREEEAAKQELANRGIPYNPDATYDPNTKDLYGRTVGRIKENYAGQYKDAADAATISGNQAYATDAAARDSFINAATTGATTFGGNFGNYSNTVSTDSSADQKDLIGLSSQAFLTKYGIDKDTYIKNKAIDKQKSGGSGSGSSSGGGFEIVG